VAVFVADVAAVQPAIERQPVGRAGSGLGAVEVLGGPRKQAGRALGPTIGVALTLLVELVAEFLVNGHQGVTFHFVVEVAQIGRGVGVGHHAVAGQAQCVGDPQPTAHQDHRDKPVGRVVPPVEVVDAF
jgi:hypothetical protein